MSNQIDLTPFRVQYSNYARDLLSDAGLSDLEEPIRGRLLAAVDGYISQVLSSTILSNLDDVALKGINEMLESGEPEEEVTTYLIASIPDLEQKIRQALESSYDTLLKQVQELTTKVGEQYLAPKPNSPTGADTSTKPGNL